MAWTISRYFAECLMAFVLTDGRSVSVTVSLTGIGLREEDALLRLPLHAKWDARGWTVEFPSGGGYGNPLPDLMAAVEVSGRSPSPKIREWLSGILSDPAGLALIMPVMES